MAYWQWQFLRWKLEYLEDWITYCAHCEKVAASAPYDPSIDPDTSLADEGSERGFKWRLSTLVDPDLPELPEGVYFYTSVPFIHEFASTDFSPTQMTEQDKAAIEKNPKLNLRGRAGPSRMHLILQQFEMSFSSDFFGYSKETEESRYTLLVIDRKAYVPKTDNEQILNYLSKSSRSFRRSEMPHTDPSDLEKIMKVYKLRKTNPELAFSEIGKRVLKDPANASSQAKALYKRAEAYIAAAPFLPFNIKSK